MDRKSDEQILKSSEVHFQTIDDLQSGGYARHYRKNINSSHDTSHHASDILSMKNMEYSEPFYNCPDCKGPNLYKSLHENYLECSDCDKLVKVSP